MILAKSKDSFLENRLTRCVKLETKFCSAAVFTRDCRRKKMCRSFFAGDCSRAEKAVFCSSRQLIFDFDKMAEQLTKNFLREAVCYLTPVIKQAGKIVVDRWNEVKVIRQKSKRDIATNIDVEVENFIKKKIISRWPEFSFWGEETGRVNSSSSSFQWLVDPIDGTKNYAGMAPFFQIHIAMVFKNKPVLGLIYNPLSNQLFSAVKKGGTRLNGEPVVSYKKVSLNEAIVDVDFRSLVEKRTREKKWMEKKLIEVIERSYRVRMSGGAFSTYLVTGAIDAYVSFMEPKPQDSAARLIIMQEAGYKICRIKTPFGEKVSIVARDPLLSELKRILLE